LACVGKFAELEKIAESVEGLGLHAFVHEGEGGEDVLELGDGEVVEAGDERVDQGARRSSMKRSATRKDWR